MDKQLEERISKLAHDFADDLITLMKESQEPMYFSIAASSRNDDYDGSGQKHDFYSFAFTEGDKVPFHIERRENHYD